MFASIGAIPSYICSYNNAVTLMQVTANTNLHHTVVVTPGKLTTAQAPSTNAWGLGS